MTLKASSIDPLFYRSSILQNVWASDIVNLIKATEQPAGSPGIYELLFSSTSAVPAPGDGFQVEETGTLFKNMLTIGG